MKFLFYIYSKLKLKGNLMFSLFLPIVHFQMDSQNLTQLTILLYIYFFQWYKIILIIQRSDISSLCAVLSLLWDGVLDLSPSPLKCYRNVSIWRGQKRRNIENIEPGDFSGGSVVKNLPSNVGELCSIPGQVTKIPHAMRQLSLFLCATTKSQSSQKYFQKEKERKQRLLQA